MAVKITPKPMAMSPIMSSLSTCAYRCREASAGRSETQPAAAERAVEREIRRGSKYDVVVLDPPKFGRGPKNETWRFETDFPVLLDHVRTLLSDRPLFVIATVYAVRLSYIAVGQALATAMPGGHVTAGEMAIREGSDRDVVLPTGLFARWTP